MTTTDTTNVKRAAFKRTCSMLSAALWISAAVAMWVLNKDSRWLWLPDALLILGFWPWFFYLQASWTWILFGILCLLIAIEIPMCKFMPPSALPTLMLPIRQHIIDYHRIDPWLLLGFTSIFYGGIRATKNLYLQLKNKF